MQKNAFSFSLHFLTSLKALQSQSHFPCAPSASFMLESPILVAEIDLDQEMRGTEKIINYRIFSIPQKLLAKRTEKEKEHRRTKNRRMQT